MIKEDIITILIDIIENKKYSNIQLNYFFRVKRYNEKEKAFVNNVINIVLKNLRYIDYILSKVAKNIQKRRIKYLLRLSIAQMIYMDSDNKGIIYEAVELAKKDSIYQSKFVKFVLHDVEKNLKEFSKIKKTNPNIYYSYPDWLVRILKEEYDNSYIDVMKSYKRKSHLGVRINSSKISIDDFLKELKKLNIEYCFRVEDVFYFNSSAILDTYLFYHNMVIIQDASSYLVVKSMDIKSDDVVLDACAAPGGKTRLMLDKYNPKLVVANDLYEHKTDALKNENNYENLEITNQNFIKYDTNKKFTKILLDVPCSGIGVLRKKPEKIYTLNTKILQEIRREQRKIFDRAYELSEKGTEITYSTCTILKSENTEQARKFLEKYSDLKVVKIKIPENVEYIEDELGGVYISYKNEYLDGFYIIKFRKE